MAPSQSPSQTEEVLPPAVVEVNNNNVDNDNNVENNNNVDNNNNVEPFGNIRINVDLLLKSVFWATIFYLLCLPDVHKLTARVVGKKVDANIVHAVVYAVLYFVVTPLI